MNLLLLSVAYHYHALADAFGIEVTRKLDPYSRRLGWDELGVQLSELRKDHPDTSLLSSERKLLAYLGYHAGDSQRLPVYAWNAHEDWQNQYDLHLDVADHPSLQKYFLFFGCMNYKMSTMIRSLNCK